MRGRAIAAFVLGALVAGPAGAAAKPCPAVPIALVTLGTMGGPVPDDNRSQPANALVRGNAVYLVDVGDGTVGQLARAGIALPRVKAVFLSHLHADHTGGLNAVLALRNQILVKDRLTVYGPPGTRQLVAGIVASMQPAAKAGYGIPGQPWGPPEESVTAVEIAGGADFAVGDMRVRAVQNSHYDFAPGSPEDQSYKSLALRFEVPGRSIAYTGDTGPSAAVEQLAAGADLLVSEMIDIDTTMARVGQNAPDMPAVARQNMVRHLTTHHLSPQDVGKLAARAGAKALVVTHFAGGTAGPARLAAVLEEVRQGFRGAVALASDLDCY
ncbi:MBL fold metallo-hydrolase [Novosphingobium flavum]|uniref:MBL fold metallo-hydrolase n=1 Tax=Novosphingobium aerophilum TaxID=2839843 RepID=UPI001639BD0C|nr:MBL fold metallo-hydrolase [Novosphingobium aerophilum]MBC2663788.1 MBL fold metallo-hydrolase [Novosphingobium aerophilum]